MKYRTYPCQKRYPKWHFEEILRGTNGHLHAKLRNYGSADARNVEVKIWNPKKETRPDNNHLERDLVEIGEAMDIYYGLDDPEIDQIKICLHVNGSGPSYTIHFDENGQPVIPARMSTEAPKLSKTFGKARLIKKKITRTLRPKDTRI